jgi:hypothetical protein
MKLFITVCFMFAIGFSVSIIVRSKKVPDLNRTFLLISRIAASICLLVMITMVADLVIPKQIIDITVEKESSSMEVSFGIYKEKMAESAYDIIRDGEKVQIHVSRIYDEIKQITLNDGKNQTLQFPTVDCYAFIFMIVIFAIPNILFFKRTYVADRAKRFGFCVGIISIILGSVSLILLGKLFLVHVIHMIPIM